MPTHAKNNFDFIRLAAATLVLVTHMYALTGRPEPTVIGANTMGVFGLMTFFSVSGYLITMSWVRDPDLGRYWMRRFLRIWPALAVVVLISALVVTPLVTGKFGLSYLRNLFPLLPYKDLEIYFDHAYKTQNGSLWTIPVEIWCYIGLAAAGFVCRSRLALIMPLVLIAFALSYVLFLEESTVLSKHFRPFLGAFFVMGSFLYLYEERIFRSRVVCGAIFAVAIALMLHGDYLFGLWVGFPLLIILVGQQSWPILQDAGRFGDFSYGIYLYAWPVQQILVEWLGAQSVAFMAPLAFVIVLALAFASWHLIEKRALRMKPGR